MNNVTQMVPVKPIPHVTSTMLKMMGKNMTAPKVAVAGISKNTADTICMMPMKFQKAPDCNMASKKNPTGLSMGNEVNRCPVALTRPVGMKAMAKSKRFIRVNRPSQACCLIQAWVFANGLGKVGDIWSVPMLGLFQCWVCSDVGSVPVVFDLARLRKLKAVVTKRGKQSV